MKVSVLKSLLVITTLLAVAGCDKMAGSAKNDNNVDGKVVSVGVRHLMLDDGDSIMFVPITETERAELKGIKKGDKVKLIGHQVPDETAKGGKALEVDEIITTSGKHVKLH